MRTEGKAQKKAIKLKLPTKKKKKKKVKHTAARS